MKILYNQIKELIPDLQADPREIGEVLTHIGFMMDGFFEVNRNKNKDYLISLEVRQNRADCLSVFGLAREIAAYYGLAVSFPISMPLLTNGSNLNIKITAPDFVKRVLAVRIDDLKNTESPVWLKEYLSLYGIDSINLLVDLSNYVMILTGYPSHLLDLSKISGDISWALNKDFNNVVTLDGSTIGLSKNIELIINDDKNILALAGLVGTRAAEIDFYSKSIILEVAVYDGVIIRKNSRNLKIVTEASTRLEKDLDPYEAERAFKLLISLVIKYCGGEIKSRIFEFYPKKHLPAPIQFDPELPTILSGIPIPKERSLEILKNLNFLVEAADSKFVATPPTYRRDILLPEDLVEEVIRIFGYNNIPNSEVPKLEVTENITPKNIILSEKIKDILSVLGFDEILSLPLTKQGDSERVNYLDWGIISAQNSMNDLYPNLRQSIAAGLFNQFDEYVKNNVKLINIFEIGKVFGKENDRYEEYDAVGAFMSSAKKDLFKMKSNIETLLRLIGFNKVAYKPSVKKPSIANPNSCWDVLIFGKPAGIMYKLKPQESMLNAYFCEFNIGKLTEYLESAKNNPIVELMQKLITLDVNIELEDDFSIQDHLDKVMNRLNPDHIWSIELIDEFPLEKKTRYTIRISYKNLSDQEAKKTHLKVFGLGQPLVRSSL